MTSGSRAESYTAESLGRWGLLQSARREALRDAWLAELPLPSPDELETFKRQWARGQGMGLERALQRWQAQQGLGVDHFNAWITRQCRWRQWCWQRFDAGLARYFLQRKPALDRLQFWRLWVADGDLIDELYQRLRCQETGFEQLLEQARAGGTWQVSCMGPLAAEQLPIELQPLLLDAAPGLLIGPQPCAEGGWLVLRVQQRWSASLDEALRSRLLEELGDQALDQALRTEAGREGPTVDS